MEFTTDQIMAVLESILEPQSKSNLLQLKMVRDLKLDQQQLFFNVHLPSANYAHRAELFEAIHLAFQEKLPELNINAHFVTKQASSEAPNTVVPQIKNFVAVASGKGGVGKSTVSANLALRLHALGFKVGVLDTDLYGPSMPTIFGIKSHRPAIRQVQGKNYLIPIDVKGIPVISLGNIIEPEQAVVLRGPRLAAIIKQFFQDTVWPDLDYLVIDLPPGTGDIQLTLVQTIPVTAVVLVTTPQEVAVADAIKAANMFMLDQIAVPIVGVVENMAFFVPDDAPEKKYFIFGKGGGQRLADFTKSKLLGQVPIYESIRARADHEISLFDEDASTELFTEIARQVVERVELRNKTMNPTKIVQMA
ncbi:MAG TPA: Mrp/NBP35 family ATP-binding protein [Saprospiraceae bacterium]|nr:Mrp/NBP35 family ATP-binding protein [Saprospiraceae bacterium]